MSNSCDRVKYVKHDSLDNNIICCLYRDTIFETRPLLHIIAYHIIINMQRLNCVEVIHVMKIFHSLCGSGIIDGLSKFRGLRVEP